MNANFLKGVYFFLLILQVSGEKGDDIYQNAMNILGGQDQVKDVTDSMGFVMNMVGGLMENIDQPGKDFDDKKNQFMSSMENASFELLEEVSLFENSAMESMEMLGPMSCMLGGPMEDADIMSGVMGGIMGSMIGEAMGQQASTASFDMRETFAELGALSGIAGGFGGSSSMNSPPDDLFGDMKYTFDGMMKEVASSMKPPSELGNLPNFGNIDEMWAEASKNMDVMKEFNKEDTFQKLDSMLSSGADKFSGMMRDISSLSSLAEKMMRSKGRTSGVTGYTSMQRIPGLNFRTQYKAAGLASTAALASGIISDVVRKSIPKQDQQEDDEIRNEKMKDVMKRVGAILRYWKVKRREGRLVPKGLSLSQYTSRKLRQMAVNLGKPSGGLGSRLKKMSDLAVKRKILHKNKFTENLDGNVPSVGQAVIKKKARMVAGTAVGRLNYQKTLRNMKTQNTMETCMSSIMPVMAEMEIMKMMQKPQIKIIDWTAPFHTSGNESWSRLGLAADLMGENWNGDWKVGPAELVPQLPSSLSENDFSQSFVPDLLKDADILDFINQASSRGASTLIDVLKGSVSTASISGETLSELPVRVLQYLPEHNSLPMSNVLTLFESDKAGEDPEAFYSFLEKFSHDYFKRLCKEATKQYLDSKWMPDGKTAALVAKQIASRYSFRPEEYESEKAYIDEILNMTCPFEIPYFIFEKDAPDVIPVVAHCMDLSFYRQDKKRIHQFHNWFERAYPKGVPIAVASQLYRMINFIPAGSLLQLGTDNVMQLIGEDSVAHFLPDIPEFQPIAETIAFFATSYYQETNNSELIRTLGPIACGLIDPLREDEVQYSQDTFDVVLKTCKDAKTAETGKEAEEKRRRCKKRLNCRIEKPIDDISGPMMKIPDFVSEEISDLELDGLNHEEILQKIQEFGPPNIESKDRKKIIIEKLISGGVEITPDVLSSLGDVASAYGADRIAQFTPEDLKIFFSRNEKIIKKMPFINKVAAVEKFLDKVEDLMNSTWDLSMLSRELPTSVIKEISSNANQEFLDIASSVRWRRSQAMPLLKRTKIMIGKNLQPITASDIRRMGRVALGLTCNDVRKMRMESMMRIATEIYQQLGDSISSDLAECIATKLYLSLRQKHKNDLKRISQDLVKVVPGPLILYFPSEILRSIRSPECEIFFKKLPRNFKRLMPHAFAHIVLDELASMRYDCMMNSRYSHASAEEIIAMEMNFNEPNKYDRKKRSNHFLNSSENFILPHDGMDGMDDSSAKHFMSMGPLICKIRPTHITYSDNMDFQSMLLMMQKCINQLNNDTLSAVQEKIMQQYGYSDSWDRETLRIIRLFVATFPRSVIESIPPSTFKEAYRFLKPPPKKRTMFGDKTDRHIDVFSLFMFKLPDKINEGGGGGTEIIDAYPSHIKYDDFYQVAVEKIVQSDIPSVDDIKLLGPMALPYLTLDNLSPNKVVEVLSVFGDAPGYKFTDNEAVIKQKLESYLSLNGSSELNDDLLQKIGKLAPMYDAAEIEEKFKFTKLETLAVLGQAKWRTPNQVDILSNVYLANTGQKISSLSGVDVVAFGNMHCFFSYSVIDGISAEAFRFALKHIGRLDCMEQGQIDIYKAKTDDSFESPLTPSTVQDMGILAAGFSSQELSEMGNGLESGLPDVNLLSHRALKVIPAQRVLNGFNDKQYSRLGQVNGATVLGRKDIFGQLNNRTKNAVFASAFGLNAGVYSGYIRFSRDFNETAMLEMETIMQEMMLNMKDVMQGNFMFGKPQGPSKKEPVKKKPSAVYGMKDVSQTTRPTPPPLAQGLSKNDLSGTFDQKYLKDRLIVEYINTAASQNLEIIEVMKGEASINEIPDDEITKIPPKLLQGLKKEELSKMTPEKVALLLDSEDISKDPKSLMNVLKKLDIDQFKEALHILSNKMNSSSGKWRPPIQIQKAVSERYFNIKHKGSADAINTFLECMCPFAAGVSPRKIMDLPLEESYIEPIIDCFDQSYKDLTKAHRKQLLRWVYTMWKQEKMHSDNVLKLKNLILDLPIARLSKDFTLADYKTFISSKIFHKLDASHPHFASLSKFIIKAMIKLDPNKFDNSTFMENLGRAKCKIQLRKVKQFMTTSGVKNHLAYTMKHCKGHNDELKEAMQDCTGDAALRLQRCQIMQDELKKMKSALKPSASPLTKAPKKPKLKRVDIKEYQMMKDVVDVFLENKDLTKLDSGEVREVAGALGALSPRELDKIPQEAILENMDMIKNNTKLTKRQKKKLFKKIQSAGFEVTDASSLKSLGELVTGVPAKQFKQLSVDGLKESLGELKKHADSLNPSQKRAILDKLNEGGIENILDADLGDLVAEIPLSELENLQTIDIEKIKSKRWRRGQATNLIKQFRKNSGKADSSLTVDDIREMGLATVGVTCKEIMKIQDDEMYEATQAVVEETESMLAIDMDECMSTKLHYSMQVINGESYIENDTNPELALTLSFIPEDVAMMIPPTELSKIPFRSCEGIMESIGQAQLNLLPSGTGDIKREELANISLECVKSNAFAYDEIDENGIVILGQLICNLSPDDWELFSSDAFVAAIPQIRDCMYRLNMDQINFLNSFLITQYGSDTSTWDEDVIGSLGPLISTLEKSMIENIDQDIFYDFLDETMPPELTDDMPVYKSVHYEDFYNKSVEVVMAQRSDIPARRRRAVNPPTYNEIIVLGPGNIAWSPDELEAISEEDFKNSLEIFGSMTKWSGTQNQVLLNRMRSIYGESSTWDSKVVADAQHLISEISLDDIARLNVADIETCISLSEVDLSNDKKAAIIDSYLSQNVMDLRELSSSELVAFGSLACGLATNHLIEIPVLSIQSSMKELGSLDCFSQTQFDILKQLSLIGRGTTIPTAAELDEMGTIAAGLSSQDLSQLPIESMAFLNPGALLLMTPTRIKVGLNSTQILVSGIGNVAALMTPRIFDELYPQQRNALRVAAYGDAAVLEDEPYIDEMNEAFNAEDFVIFAEDNSGEMISIDEESTEAPATTTTTPGSGAEALLSRRFLFLLIFINIAMNYMGYV